MPGTNACQMSASLSASGIWVSVPAASNRHNVTLVATLEASAKFVPAMPRCSPGVAPSGNSRPGSAAGRPFGAARAAGTVAGRGGGLASGHGWAFRCCVAQDVAEGPDRAVAAQDHVGDQAGPPGLVEGADRGAVVAVEVLAEDQVVLPGRIGLHLLGPAEAGPPPVRVPGEQRDQPVLQVGDDQVQGEPLARAGRVLDLEVIAVEPVVALEGFDHQVVDRHPDRAAPVGVAAEHRRGRLGRLIVDRGLVALGVELVGMIAVVGRQRAQPVRGQELGLVEQLGEQPLQLVRPGHRQQQPLGAGLAAQLRGLGQFLRCPRRPASAGTARSSCSWSSPVAACHRR